MQRKPNTVIITVWSDYGDYVTYRKMSEGNIPLICIVNITVDSKEKFAYLNQILQQQNQLSYRLMYLIKLIYCHSQNHHCHSTLTLNVHLLELQE